MYQFYHSEKLQSTKTAYLKSKTLFRFYHSEKLQSTKTCSDMVPPKFHFIIAKNYRVLKLAFLLVLYL